MEGDCSDLPFAEDYSTWSDSFLKSFLEEPGCSSYGWGPLQVYPAQTEILRQDTPSDAVYFMKSGAVKLTWVDPHGREVIAGLRHRNWLTGAPAVLLEKPYSFTITTLTRCELRCISAKNFLALTRTNTEFAMHVMKLLSREIFDRGKKLVMLGCVSAADRLKYLLSTFVAVHARTSRKGVKLHLPLKHKELAQMLAVTPEHLSRLMKELEQKRCIRREKDGSIVLNPSCFE
ncbi:MAG: Crp/Fnr family transcriptional regulator [Nitrospirota bacterium]